MPELLQDVGRAAGSEEAERLPCLTTGAPAPATTIAAIVEMFTVWPVAAGAARCRRPDRRP